MALRALYLLRGLLLPAFVLVPPPSLSQPAPDWPNVAPRVAAAVRPALGLAAEWLQKPSCALVLGDFRHAETGETLAEVLTAKGHEPRGYLGTIYFLDGSGRPQCTDRRTLAFAPRGSAVVFVCSEQFRRATRSNWPFAAAVLIHESFHTLGLGENPPASAEITGRIAQRCW